jgi:hypothetical protein
MKDFEGFITKIEEKYDKENEIAYVQITIDSSIITLEEFRELHLGKIMITQ